MIFKGKCVVASKVNARGVRVYIPEQILKASQRYVIPFRFFSYRFSPLHPTLYSVGCSSVLPIVYSSVVASITDPFSVASLQATLNYLFAQQNQRKRGSTLSVSRDIYRMIASNE
jgi:hypothetical protein